MSESLRRIQKKVWNFNTNMISIIDGCQQDFKFAQRCLTVYDFCVFDLSELWVEDLAFLISLLCYRF